MVLATFGGEGGINFGNMQSNQLSSNTNFDPKDIRGKVNQWVKQNALLPSQVKPGDLLKAAKEKGGSEMALAAMQEYSSLKLAAASNVAGIEQAAVGYAKGMMKVDQRLQGIRADYGHAEIQYGVQTGIAGAEFGGYKQAAQNHWDF